MDTGRATELLHAHQDGLLAHIDGSMALLGGTPDEAVVPLARARWEALRLVRAYQLFKHGELFDPLIAYGTAEQRRVAERMKTRCVLSAQQFVDHVTTWTMTDAATDWDRYRAALIALTEGLRREIAAERRGCEQLLAGMSHMRAPMRARA